MGVIPEVIPGVILKEDGLDAHLCELFPRCGGLFSKLYNKINFQLERRINMANLQIVEISGKSRTGKTILAKNLAEGFTHQNYSNSHFISYVGDLQDQLDLLKYLTIVTNDVLVIDEINQQTVPNESALINYICANIDKLSAIVLSGTNQEKIAQLSKELQTNNTAHVIKLIAK